LIAIAIGGNVLIVLAVLNGFGSPAPANDVFGRPDVEVPISDAVPRFISPVGRSVEAEQWPDVPPIRMHLVLARLDPDAQRGFFTAEIFTPARLLRRIVGRAGRPAVVEQDGSYRLTRFGRGLALPLNIEGGYAGSTGLRDSLAMSKIVRVTNSGEHTLTIDFSVPFQGMPSAFPEDWYELASSVDIRPPTSWLFADRSSGVSLFPVQIAFAVGAAMRGYRVSMVSKPHVDGSFLRLVIETDGQTRTLAYVTAVIPILLALVAFGLLIASLNGGFSRLRVQELALTIVLGVLAVFPIREVTVPAALHGTTRVDLLLTLGVTLSVGVLLLALALQLGLPEGVRRRP